MMFLDVINRMIYTTVSGPKGAHLFFLYRRMCLFKSVTLEEAGIEPRTSQT